MSRNTLAADDDDLCEDCRWNEHHQQLKEQRDRERRQMETEENEAMQEYARKEKDREKRIVEDDTAKQRQVQQDILEMNKHLMLQKQQRDNDNSGTDWVFANRPSTAETRRSRQQVARQELSSQIEQKSARQALDDEAFTDRELDLMRRGEPLPAPVSYRHASSLGVNDGRQVDFGNDQGAQEQLTERRKRDQDHRHALETQIAQNRQAADHKLMGKPWFVERQRPDADFKDRKAVVITDQAARVAKQQRAVNNLEQFLAADEAAKHQRHMDLLARRETIRAQAAKELEEKEKIKRDRLAAERRREEEHRARSRVSQMQASPKLSHHQTNHENGGQFLSPNQHLQVSSPMAVRRRRASEGAQTPPKCVDRHCRNCQRTIRPMSIGGMQRGGAGLSNNTAYWLGGTHRSEPRPIGTDLEEYARYAPFRDTKVMSRYL